MLKNTLLSEQIESCETMSLEAAFRELLSGEAGKCIEPRELAEHLLWKNHITKNEYEQITNYEGTTEQRHIVSHTQNPIIAGNHLLVEMKI